MSEFKFEYIERTHSPEEFGAVFDRLFNTHLEHQLLLSEEETLKSKLETMKQDIELSKSVLQEETRITVRELGSQLRIECQ